MIIRQSLGREETLALVQAMESRVKMVRLSGEVTLDINALIEYSGQGVCRDVNLVDCAGYQPAYRYREDLKTWARNRNWRVDVDDHHRCFVIR